MILFLSLGCAPPEHFPRKERTPASQRRIEGWDLQAALGQPFTLVGVNYPLTNQRLYAVGEDAEVLSFIELPEWVYDPDTGEEMPGILMDFELLDNGHIVFAMMNKGVFEIDPDGEVVDQRISDASHDFDVLPNGNLLEANTWAAKGDYQITERDPEGEVVWGWRAQQLRSPDVRDVEEHFEGWLHINSVERLSDGITRGCLRDANQIVDIDASGEIVRTLTPKKGERPHGMETTDAGTVLVATREPNRIAEIDLETGEEVWAFGDSDLRGIRDIDRLPNGNTLFTAEHEVVEVTPDREVAWKWIVPEIEGQALPMDEVTPVMATLRVQADGSFSNR